MNSFTRSTTVKRRTAAVLGGIAAAALLLTGCAAASSDAGAAEKPAANDDPTMAPIAEAVALVPEAPAESGTLRVAIPTNEPPTQFYREGTKDMTGINPDMARLGAGALGLKIDIVVSNFDSIIPGLAADRFDMTVSSMTPTKERMESLDFVDYMNMGSAIAVPAGNPGKLSFDNLCGKQVAVLTGSYQLTTYVPGLDEACKAAGKDGLTIQQFQDTRQAISALVSGRADVVYADQPILGYAATQNSDIEVAEVNNLDAVAVGSPNSTKLVDAIAEAMKVIIVSPEYKDVLAKYGMDSSALTEVRVNFPQG